MLFIAHEASRFVSVARHNSPIPRMSEANVASGLAGEFLSTGRHEMAPKTGKTCSLADLDNPRK